jgi:DNA repair protein RecO (recombination protein O)
MKRAEYYRDIKGVVVSSVDVGERDRLITVLTAEEGLITLLAPSARVAKSRLMSPTQLLSYSSFTVTERGERLVLKEAHSIDTFYGLREGLSRAALASYIAEVVSYTGTEQPDAQLLRLVLNTLYATERELYPLAQIKAAFELRYATELGFMPDMGGCSICGGAPTGAVLHIERGNLVCRDCRDSLEDSMRREDTPHESLVALLSPATIAAIDYITSAPLERLFSFKLEEDELHLLGIAAEEYLLYHTDHIYTSLEFYKQVCD